MQNPYTKIRGAPLLQVQFSRSASLPSPALAVGPVGGEVEIAVAAGREVGIGLVPRILGTLDT
jgi:hypothetical protein